MGSAFAFRTTLRVSTLLTLPFVAACAGLGGGDGSGLSIGLDEGVRYAPPEAAIDEADSARDPRRTAPRVASVPNPPWQDEDYRAETIFNRNHRELLDRARGYRPDVEIAFQHLDGQQLRGNNAEFDSDAFRGDIAHELVIDPDSWVRVGAHFQARDFDFGSGFVAGASGVDDDEMLYETSLVIGGGTFIEDNLFVEAQFEPGLYSDFGGTLSSDDWQFFGQVQGTYEVDEWFYWRGGVRTDNRFEDVDLYPQLGLMWRFLEDWRVDVLLPQHIVVSWNPAAEWIFDLGMSLEGQEYAVRSPSGFGSERNKWEVRELELYAGARWRFNDQLSTFGRFGGVVAGDYEFNGVGNTQSSGSPEGAVFFEVGAGWNF